MGNKKIIWIVAGIIGLVVLIFNPVSRKIFAIFAWVGHTRDQIRSLEAKLQTPDIYGPVAERLAIYCQSDQSFFPSYLSHTWLPDELAAVGEGWGSVSTNGAHIEMGGGFHHYGYQLQLVDADSESIGGSEARSGANESTNHWKLFMYSEGSDDKLLTMVAMPAKRCLSMDELQKVTSASYDKSIVKDSSAYRGKVLSLFRFGKTNEAKDVCLQWINREPNLWLPRFTLAHVRCRLGESEESAKEFGDWVKSNPNFAHYNYLALFFYREGKTNEALNAVRLSLEQQFAEPAGTEGNKFSLGFNGSMIAYIAGDYDLSLTNCDRMLAHPRKEQWWTRKVMKVKAAALLNKGNQTAAHQAINLAEKLEDKNLSFSLPGMIASDRYLRKAIEANDKSAIVACGPWLDESESWFTPFDVDETGIHGMQDVPSPYPNTWKSDKMNPDEAKAGGEAASN